MTRRNHRETVTGQDRESLQAATANSRNVPQTAPYIALGLTLMQQMDSVIAMRWMELLRSYFWPGPVLNGRQQYTVQARNIVIRDFWERDAKPMPHDQHQPGELTGLLFWDSDQLPPMIVPQQEGPPLLFTEHLSKLLLENPDKGVIAGLYYSRNSQFIRKQTPYGEQIVEYPHEPVAYNRNEEGTKGAYNYLTFEQMTHQILPVPQRLQLHQVGGAGTGAMLIRRQVLEKMRELKGDNVFEAPSAPGKENQGMQWTEDLYFCEEVTQRLKETIWLDSAAVSGHQGDRVWIADQHYLASHGMIGMTAEAAEHAQKPRREIWRP